MLHLSTWNRILKRYVIIIIFIIIEHNFKDTLTLLSIHMESGS